MNRENESIRLFECPACESGGKIRTGGREIICVLCLGEGILTETEVRKHFGKFADHYMEKHEVKVESEG